MRTEEHGADIYEDFIRALRAFQSLQMICQYWERNRGVGNTKEVLTRDTRRDVIYLFGGHAGYIHRMLYEAGYSESTTQLVSLQKFVNSGAIQSRHDPLIVDHFVIQQLVDEMAPLFLLDSPAAMLAAIMGSVQSLTSENERLQLEVIRLSEKDQ